MMDKGLYQKYIITKTSGKPLADGFEAIVLRIDGGRYLRACRAGAQAFANAVREDNPLLASDLDDKLQKLNEADKCPECDGEGEIRWTQIDEPMAVDGMAFRLGVGVWECEKDCPTCNGTGGKKLDSTREKIEQVVYDHVYVGMNDAGLPYLSIQDEFHTEIIALLPKPIDLPELRETIKKTLCKENGICIRCQVDGDVCFECQLDQIIVLIEPLIKDAREQERERIIKGIHSIEFESNSATDFLNKVLYYIRHLKGGSLMVGYFNHEPKEDEVLLEEIAKIITGEPSKMEDGTDDPLHEMDIDNNMDDAKLILTKAREAVGGVRSPYFHTTHMNQTYPCKACVFDEAIQAILKALGGE